jgi:hypothetical protein
VYCVVLEARTLTKSRDRNTQVQERALSLSNVAQIRDGVSQPAETGNASAGARMVMVCAGFQNKRHGSIDLAALVQHLCRPLYLRKAPIKVDTTADP